MLYQLPHVINARQFDRNWLLGFAEEVKSMDLVLNSTTWWADRRRDELAEQFKRHSIGIAFFEKSTRTFISFETAARNLGIDVKFALPSFEAISSVVKGESFEHSIRILAGNLKPWARGALIIRHPLEGSALTAAKISPVPIINGGDGARQHPTQALLDFSYLFKLYGCIDGLKIALVGDLKHGRTIRSLAYLLAKFKDVEIFFVSPEEFSVGQDIKDYLVRHQVRYHEVRDIHEIVAKTTVIYMTRIQLERMGDQEIDLDQLKGQIQQFFSISPSVVQMLRQDHVIMHPMPIDQKTCEIPTAVDLIPQAHYFLQADYGVPVRMALLHEMFFGKIPTVPEDI
jgi:aspartate carbamoyltransferase catalytic subunit